jgi:MFS family permease
VTQQRIPGPARRVLAGLAVSALGNGLVLPFLVVYLHQVRGIPIAVAGLVVAWEAVVAFALGPVAGTVIDRVGPRIVLTVAPLVMAAGTAGYAFVHVPLQAFAFAGLVAVGQAAMWPAGATLLSRLVAESERQRIFGLQFMILNLGIGVGGLISGLVVSVHRPATFSWLYIADALTFVVYSTVLATMRGYGGRLPAAELPAEGSDRSGWSQVLRDRSMMRLVILNLVLLTSGYGALDVGYPVFATQVLGLPARAVAFGFVGNTATIVVGQMLVIRLVAGRSRSRMIGLVGLIWAASWSLAAVALHSVSTDVRLLMILLAPIVFAVGETVFQPVVPALTNELAPEHLRGRYNALASVTWNLAGMLGPAFAGVLIGGGHAVLWLLTVIGGCLIASAGTFWLRRVLTPSQDGRVPPEPVLAVRD